MIKTNSGIIILEIPQHAYQEGLRYIFQTIAILGPIYLDRVTYQTPSKCRG